MSRTKEVQRAESPAKANIFFNGKLGKFSTFKEDDEGLSEIELPFRFVVVDDGAHRITGKKGLERDAPKFKSNLAHDGYSTRLRVWLDNAQETVIAEGTWTSMSERIYPLGARYTKVIYILTDLGQGKVLAALHLKGRAFSSWIDATKKIDPCGDVSFAVNRVQMMSGTKGEPSLVPVFEVVVGGMWVKIGTIEADGKIDRLEIKRECAQSIAEMRDELRYCVQQKDTLIKENIALNRRVAALEARLKR